MAFSPTRRSLTLAIAAAGLPLLARADAYPSRPISLLLPSSPGSALDNAARRLAPMLEKALKQPVTIENKPGAGGVIGTTQLARSAPDGYTLGLVSSTYSASPSLYPVSYDPLRDIQPVCMLTGGPLVLVVNPAKVPVENLQQLLELGRKRQDDRPLTFGNSGSGSTVHLAAARLSILGKMKISHVPYRVTSGYTTDLIGGVLDAGFLPVVVALPFINDGRLRAIGVSTAQRSATLPNVPTLQELGLKGFDVDGWVALVVPAKVPKPIVQRLHAEVLRAVKDPDFVKFTHDSGGYVIGSSVEEAEKTFARELAESARIIQQMGIKPE